MKIMDRLVLVNSKFRIRKLRTIITIITASILFGVIISVLFISRGFLNGLEGASKAALGNDVILSVNRQTTGFDTSEVKDKAIALYNNSTDKNKQYPIITPDVINGTTFPAYLDTNNKFAIAAANIFSPKQIQESTNTVAKLINPYEGKVVGSVTSYCTANPLFIKKLTPDGYDGMMSCSSNIPGERIIVVNSDILYPIVKDVKQKNDVIQIIIPLGQAAKILDISVPNYHNPNSTSSLKNFINTVNKRAIGFQFKGTQTINNQKNELTYEIVGIIPSYEISTIDPYSVNPLESTLRSLVNTNDNLQSFIVTNSKSTAFKSAYNYNISENSNDILASFKDAGSANSFTEKIDPQSGIGAVEFIANRVNIYDQFTLIDRVIVVFAIIFSIIASIIMAGTISRIIDDERQTIALYRAVGATTGDILQIFASYIFVLSIQIAICATVIGLIISGITTITNTSLITANIGVLYNISTLSPVTFIGYDSRIFLIILAIIFVGLICLLLILKKLISKNIIRDMRS